MRRLSGTALHRTALIATAAVIALLAGCGGDGDGSGDSTVAEGGSAATVNGQSGGGGQSPADFGEEAVPADRAATGGSVQGFLRAFADGDWSTACSLMSASTQKNLELFVEGAASESLQKPCTELIKALHAQIPAKRLPPDRIEVTGARIEDDRGFVLYRDEEGTSSAFPVVREDDAWKVAAIAGSSLP